MSPDDDDALDDDAADDGESLAFLRRVAKVTDVQTAPGKRVRPGGRVASYAIEREIGRGGMGVVYEAVHEQSGRRVALKTLLARIGARAEMRARLLREADAAARIRHPNVVEVLDVGVADDVPYVVMELLEGENLAARLARALPSGLDGAELHRTLLPVLSAVDAAHRAGVVHRDLKPANVFLARGAGDATRPKVLDFGVSRLLDPGSTLAALTDPRAMLGTPAYMAPEQLADVRSASAKSDQYALGVVLYECATGRRPFTARSTFELVRAIARAEFPPPEAVRPGLSSALASVVLRAMRLRPDERFESVDALGAALSTALATA